jgi:hypothetical protein
MNDTFGAMVFWELVLYLSQYGNIAAISQLEFELNQPAAILSLWTRGSAIHDSNYITIRHF